MVNKSLLINRVLRGTVAVYGLVGLVACMTFPTNGDINNATVFHWENDYVVMAKFIEDHKGCLGVRGVQVKSQMYNLNFY